MKGCRRVSVGFLLFAALLAFDAGRPGESGTGAMWIAPELVDALVPHQPCSQAVSLGTRELVFETLEADLGDDLPHLMADGAREVVAFEWNPATGELSYSTAATTAIFSDLAAPHRSASAALPSNCGSR